MRKSDRTRPHTHTPTRCCMATDMIAFRTLGAAAAVGGGADAADAATGGDGEGDATAEDGEATGERARELMVNELQQDGED